MIQKAFVDESMGITQIKEWYRWFKNGRTSVNSDPRSGRPSLTTTPENIERVRLAIEGDRRLTVRELENDLGIPKTTVWDILNKILGMTRVCAKFIPKLLTTDHKDLRSEIALDNLQMVSDDENVLKKVITGGESWVYGYDPETKQQSSHCKRPNEPRPKKARQSRSHVKLMLIIFCDCEGVVHYSSDIAPCDFWMFPKLKMALKGKRFDEIEPFQNLHSRTALRCEAPLGACGSIKWGLLPRMPRSG